MRPWPEFPQNRVLSQGELPCTLCGSGKADHRRRAHAYCPYESCAICGQCAVCRNSHGDYAAACRAVTCP